MCPGAFGLDPLTSHRGLALDSLAGAAEWGLDQFFRHPLSSVGV